MFNAIQSFFSPAATAPAAPQSATEAKSQATVIAAGQPAVVSINANYTTPYRWQVVSADQGLAITDSYKSNPNPRGMMGVGGQAQFSIEPGTAKPGVYQVELGLCRFGSNDPVESKTVTVQVLGSTADDTVSVKQGESATVKLAANYTTPFTWNVTNAPEGIDVSTKYVTNPNPNRMMGVGGKLHVTTTATNVEPGTYQVELGNFYIGDESRPVSTHTVDIVVS